MVFIVFGLIYCSISLVNHFIFKTYALDLGIRNHAIYNYAHFRIDHTTLLSPYGKNLLSDHFTLITILISPLYWLFGSYSLLVAQIAFVLFGGYGIYTYFKHYISSSFGILAAIHFFSIWGIYTALAFDYHENVVAAMFVPWFIFFFRKEKWLKAFLFFILILISKENMALWAIFIALGLCIDKIKNKKSVLIGLTLAAIACIYFITVVKVVMPSLSENGSNYSHFYYSSLGTNFSEAIETIVTKPIYTLKLLFINHINDPSANGIKEELFITILFSGGIALFLKPQYLIMLIPIFAQKLFSDDMTKWGINAHYSIEFVPILCLAVFSFIGDINIKYRKYFCYAVIISTMLITFLRLESRKAKWFSPQREQFYRAWHYERHFDVLKLNKVLKTIPKNAIVSAHSPIVPHIAFRDYIYEFPRIHDAEYIVLIDNEDIYPLFGNQLQQKIKTLFDDVNWEVFYHEDHILIFKHTKLVIPLSFYTKKEN